MISFLISVIYELSLHFSISDSIRSTLSTASAPDSFQHDFVVHHDLPWPSNETQLHWQKKNGENVNKFFNNYRDHVSEGPTCTVVRNSCRPSANSEVCIWRLLRTCASSWKLCQPKVSTLFYFRNPSWPSYKSTVSLYCWWLMQGSAQLAVRIEGPVLTVTWAWTSGIATLLVHHT